LWTEARIWLAELLGGAAEPAPQSPSSIWDYAGWGIDPNGGDTTGTVCPSDGLDCTGPLG
jgi:hypothetical protein